MNSKEYFDEVATQWDNMRQSFFSEDIREKAFSVAGVKKGKIAADKVGRNGRVIDIDMTPEMVEKARENAEKGKYENVEFRLK